MKYILSLLLFLSIAYSSFGEDTITKEPNVPKIEPGMQYVSVIQILENAEWKKLDEKTISTEKQTINIVVYRYDTKSLTILEKHIKSKFEFTFVNDHLVNIDQYSKKNELMVKGVQRIYVW